MQGIPKDMLERELGRLNLQILLLRAELEAAQEQPAEHDVAAERPDEK